METTQMPVNRWTEKSNDHMMGYYQATKMYDVFIHDTAWMNLEVSHKRSHCPLYEMSKIHESIETESRLVIAKKLRRRNGRDNELQVTASYQVPFGEDEHVLKSGGNDRCTILWIYKTLLNWHFKMVNFMRCVNYTSIFNWGKKILIMKKYWAQ